jgi:acyl-CoA dehydrogenase
VNELDQFRSDVRAWLNANCPESMRSPYRSEADICWGGRDSKFQSDDQQAWLQRMAEKGWTAPSWPVEYGGGGLDREHAKILKQEMKRINARAPMYSFGISMIGPALLKYASEELKMQHLPPIVRGEIRWVQGYSEPNAGSDLASLQARADDMGDHYTVNGSKIWTSYGDKGDWMFALIRTDTETTKHQGISLILFDMKTPGITTRPILLISGKSPFTETFFENTRMEKNQVVGEPNQGWTIAKYLLTHEREMIGETGNLQSGVELLSRIAVKKLGLDHGRLSNLMLRTDIARFEIDEVCHQLTMERARDEAKAGASLGPAASMFKFYGTELNKRRYELLMSVGSNDALAWEGSQSNAGQLPRRWLRTKGNSIEGGTSEIQLNIVAKRILGLPG